MQVRESRVIILWVGLALVLTGLYFIIPFSPESKFVGEWERVSPPINESAIVDSGENFVGSGGSYSITCNVVAPRHIYFFGDKKYAASSALFAGGEYLAKKNVLRMQTVRGFEIVRYNQAENGQLTLTFNDVLTDCIAAYERAGG